jgi:hypothetical protein
MARLLDLIPPDRSKEPARKNTIYKLFKYHFHLICPGLQMKTKWCAHVTNILNVTKCNLETNVPCSIWGLLPSFAPLFHCNPLQVFSAVDFTCTTLLLTTHTTVISWATKGMKTDNQTRLGTGRWPDIKESAILATPQLRRVSDWLASGRMIPEEPDASEAKLEYNSSLERHTSLNLEHKAEVWAMTGPDQIGHGNISEANW